MSNRIKSITVRFNKEILPFQHVRIEANSTVTKEDDVEEVREELESFLEKMCDNIQRRLYKGSKKSSPNTSIEEEEKKKDDVPY